MDAFTLQHIFNAVLILLVAMFGWLRKADKEIMNDIKDDVKALDLKDSNMSTSLNALAVEIAANYVNKADLNRLEDHITDKFDRLDSKFDNLDNKLETVLERRLHPRD